MGMRQAGGSTGTARPKRRVQEADGSPGARSAAPTRGGRRGVGRALVNAMVLVAGLVVPAGALGALPDGRAYEQVSPVEKGGVDAVGMSVFFPAQASVNGESFAYMNLGSFGGPTGSELPNAYVASRMSTGWETTSVTPPTTQGTTAGGVTLGYDFSPDLSQVVIKVPFQQLTANAPAGVFNLFLRSPDGSYRLITTNPPTAPVPPPSECAFCWETDESAFVGASAGYRHVLFEANASLVPGAPGGEIANLYENAEGGVRLVGYLPDNTIAAEGAVPGSGLNMFYSATNRGVDALHDISTDGSHIIFEAAADGGTPSEAGQSGKTELYDRVNGSSTVEVSAPSQGAHPVNPEPEEAKFWAASADGSVVYFTSKAELTSESNTGTSNGGQDLYRYEVPSESIPNGKLTDLTVDNEPVDSAKGAKVEGVVGSSEDGSYVYFVATGELVAGRGEDGKPKLYVWHRGEPVRFIAQLASADKADWEARPSTEQGYVTSDGRYVAFASINAITSYNNTDEISGKADAEVYLYNVENESLVCASCDPSGARPIGSAFIGATLKEKSGTPFHQPRSVIDPEGGPVRLFFSSPDPLTPEAGNPYVKVFEYENGHVYMLSSPVHASNDMFLDASANGNDVFFATRDRLISSDTDGFADVYDARICTSESPCLPPSAPLPVPCAASVCQNVSGTAPSLLAPASVSFTGLGNVTPVAPKPAVKKINHKATHTHKKRKRKKRKKGRRASVVRHHRSR